MKRITVSITDDHLALRMGLKQLLEKDKDIFVTLLSGSGIELIQQLEEEKQLPDICIIDISMPGIDGIETTKIVKERWSNIKVVMISFLYSDLNMQLAYQYGAESFITKNAGHFEYFNAIHDVMNSGEARKINSSKIKSVDSYLPSEREIQFLKLCCEDIHYCEIARRMNISEKTVNRHAENLFEKLGIKSRAGLINYAFRNGLVSVDQPL